MDVLISLCILVYQVLAISGFPDNTTLWCAGRDQIYHTDSTLQWLSGDTQLNVSPINIAHPDTSLVSASFLYRNNYVVLTDSGTRTLIIYREASGGIYVNVGVSAGIGELAVDWVNMNVYWSDSIYSWIGLQALPRDPASSTYNDKQRIVVEKAVQKPRGVAVHPQRKYIFWTDYGGTARIERASLTGRDRKVLIWTGLIRPVSITSDPGSVSLYWIDSVRASVETCDLDGQGRRVLLQSLGFTLTSVAVFQNHLLYTEAKEKTVHAVSKVTGEQSARALTSDKEPLGVMVYSESLQPFTSSACDNYGCQHICIEEEGGPTCLCEGGFTLNVDGKACSEGTASSIWKSVFYSDGSKICALPITTFNSVHYLPVHTTCLHTDTDIGHLTPHVRMSTIFYTSDTSVKKLEIGVGVSTVTTASNTVTGLVFDSVEGNVIWSEKDAGVIRRAGTAASSPSSVVFSGLDSPTALAIDARNRIVFWVSSIASARIYKGTLTTLSPSILVGSDLKQPTRLTFDLQRNRLYWTEDGRLGSIQSTGQGRTNYPLSPIPSYVGITVFKDYIVWSAKEQSMNLTVSAMDESDNSLTVPVTFPVPDVTDITDIAMYDTDGETDLTDGCDYKNGGCEHVCMPLDVGHRCQCHFGFSLQSDDVSCISRMVATDFFLVLDNIHNRIYQIGDITDTASIQAVHLQLDNTPSLMTYNTRSGHVVWYDARENIIMKAGLDGTDETVVITTDGLTVMDMVVDSSTGDIFYTCTNQQGTGSLRMVTSLGQGHVLLTTQGIPGPLAIHPPSRSMVWGEGNRIQKAAMDGSGEITLASSDLTLVEDLSFDTSGDTLYVADVAGDKLESIVLQTRSRNILRENTQEYPTSVTVKGDNLYYLTHSGRNIKTINKNTGAELQSLPDVAEFGHLSGLYVYIDTVTPSSSETTRTTETAETTTFTTEEEVTSPAPPAVPAASSSSTGIIAGICVAILLLLVVIIVVAIFVKRRRSMSSKHKALSMSSSQQPIVKVEEVYDDISPSVDDPRYLSFRRINPQLAGLREGAEINNPVYDAAYYLSVASDHLPVPPPRPASSFTPNTRRKMFRSESPMPDYDTANSDADAASYVDVIED